MAGRAMFVSSITRYGGGERWMCDAAAGLANRGHDVMVAVRPGSELERRIRTLGIDCHPVEMRGDLDPAAVCRLRSLMRRFTPDAVCVNLDREVRLCALALFFAGMGSMRGGGGGTRPRLIPRRGSEFPLKNAFHYRFVYTRTVHAVIANSIATRNTMLSNAPWFEPVRARVIYNGIDFAHYDELRADEERIRRSFRRELGAAGDAPLITLAGELTARKGHRFILEAAGGLVRAHPDARFLFAGEGDARGEIEREIHARHLEKYVHLLGFREDMPELLAASDIVVLPSSVEGFGYVLAEAMAAARPVVASRASSIPEVVEDGVTGLLHRPGEADEIGAHLLRLIEDPALRSAMGEAGYRRAREHFHLDRMLDEVEELFFD